MERNLLLLGMLRLREMHGYQLNEFIEAHLGTSVQLTKPTAYNLLNKLAEEGLISYREEQEGNRPPRRVYFITPEGETAFQEMLRQSLANYHPVEFRSDIALAFLDVMPAEEALPLLQQRRSVIEGLLQSLHDFGEEHQGGFQLVIERQKRHLLAELEWLDKMMAHLKTEKRGN